MLKIPQCTLLIGPDCKTCPSPDHYFMAAFAFLLTLGLLSTLYLSHTKAPSWTIAATLFLTIFHSVTYLALALSDPSIAQATEPIAEGSDRTRYEMTSKIDFVAGVILMSFVGAIIVRDVECAYKITTTTAYGRLNASEAAINAYFTCFTS